jgi:hypothetical protein
MQFVGRLEGFIPTNKPVSNLPMNLRIIAVEDYGRGPQGIVPVYTVVAPQR